MKYRKNYIAIKTKSNYKINDPKSTIKIKTKIQELVNVISRLPS
jgi:hypothetical protein